MLAGCGKGQDDPARDDVAKVKLRKQALDWLKAEMVAWTRMLANANEQQRGFIPQTLQQWKQDADLAGIRDDAGLASLPEAERAALEQLWNDVDELLTKAAGRK